MPHLVMLDFQPLTMTFLTESTLATQASEAREMGEEMEIDFHIMNIDVNQNLGRTKQLTSIETSI